MLTSVESASDGIASRLNNKNNLMKIFSRVYASMSGRSCCRIYIHIFNQEAVICRKRRFNEPAAGSSLTINEAQYNRKRTDVIL